MPQMPEDSPFVAAFFRLYQAFAKAVRGIDGCEAYADKIDQWNKKKQLTQFIDVAEPMRCGFQILNHGDIWLNNMMFQSDADNNPLDVSMIDFQGPFWASPVVDIMYFLLSSVADDIKVEHFDHFVEFYHEQLTEALKKLKFDQHIPTLAELHIDLLEKGYFGL